MIITISGTAGSGKSTVGKILTEKLGAERIYVGGIRRKLAKEKKMSIMQLNEYAKTHSETDIDVDERVATDAKALEMEGKKVIVEGRTQFHFIPDSIKVFIKVDPKVGAERIWKDLQKKSTKESRNEGDIKSLEEMEKEVIKRDEEDAQRYLKYYDIDHRDESHYDLVIDSTSKSAEEVANEVMNFVNSKK